MWSSDRLRRAGAGLALGALLTVAGCTGRPLYAGVAPDGSQMETLANLRGRIAVSEPNTRTDQIVRNALLLRLNAGERVAEPAYEVRLKVAGAERGITIETDGVPRSAIYVMTTDYKLVRLSDNVTIDDGRRQVPVPFDRTSQLFQSQRALLDAREQAGRETAAQLELAIARALQETAAGS